MIEPSSLIIASLNAVFGIRFSIQTGVVAGFSAANPTNEGILGFFT
jgi:hypothetical protein